MQLLSIDMSLAELVGHELHRTAILDRYGLDYCCGGKTTLREACGARALDAEVLLAELSAAQPSTTATPLPNGSLADLTAHLVETHHQYLKTEMPRLAALVSKVAEVHGPRHPELLEVAAVYHRFHEEMEAHLAKEETILFPTIRELEATGDERAKAFVHQPIRVMEFEHDTAGNDLRRLHELTSGYAVPEDACTTYRAMLAGLMELEADTHQHIHKENNLLFPQVQTLTQAQALR